MKLNLFSPQTGICPIKIVLFAVDISVLRRRPRYPSCVPSSVPSICVSFGVRYIPYSFPNSIIFNLFIPNFFPFLFIAGVSNDSVPEFP